MLQYTRFSQLPTADDLPETDGKPVDSELNIWVSAFLSVSLAWIWRDRTDWFWGINLGIYYNPDLPAIVPDGFLSLGVELVREERGRLSYVLWQERDVVPTLVLEYVSQTYGGEYDDKMDKYAQLGVTYYLVYNPLYWQRDRHQPFEVYRLQGRQYVRHSGSPAWFPEIGLGIGQARGAFRGWTREWIYWFDQDGHRLLAPDEELIRIEHQLRQERQRADQQQQRADQQQQRADQQQQRADQEQQQRQELLQRLRLLSPEQLRAIGLDPTQLEE